MADSVIRSTSVVSLGCYIRRFHPTLPQSIILTVNIYEGGSLPPKTVPFQTWTISANFGASFENVPNSNIPGSDLEVPHDEWGWLDMSLSPEYTRTILKTATSDQQPQHLLLAAFFLSFRSQFGANVLAAGIEFPGYGRSATPGDFDVSRTIGFFSFYQLITLHDQPTLPLLLLHVKKLVDKITYQKHDPKR
jgi:hypothetical protein